ncbi:MAG: tyrosine-type recombinase/integrase [Betaproteobacteria bacterium]|nr:tyrosine-type recombinase/integrase [Betaproteobacteria bacterium]
MLLAFCAQRVGEVVGATWTEFDLDAGTWAIPRERMKRKEEARGEHLVPIPPKLLSALREWRRSDGEAAVFVCPAPRDAEGHVTREAIEKFYNRTLNSLASILRTRGDRCSRRWRGTLARPRMSWRRSSIT